MIKDSVDCETKIVSTIGNVLKEIVRHFQSVNMWVLLEGNLRQEWLSTNNMSEARIWTNQVGFTSTNRVMMSPTLVALSLNMLRVTILLSYMQENTYTSRGLTHIGMA